MALTEIGARLRLAGAPAFKRDADKGADGLENLARKANRADREVGGLERAARRAGSAIGSIGRGAALGGIGAAAAGIGALSVGLLQGFRDAASMQTMLARTGAVIKSTGGAANVSAASILKMSDKLESLSMMDQEAILNGQNLLLTFTKIRNEAGKGNDVFDQATLAMVNMSSAMGTDTKGAAIQLGKALNDPVKGVTALGKAGVSFSKQQKEQIKSLVASGKTMDAQKLILKELEVQFGGAAKAAGSGFEGAMFRAKDAVGDLFRDVATPLLPGFTKRLEDLSGYLTNTATPAILGFIDGFQQGTGDGGAFRDDLVGVWEATKDLGEGLQTAYEKTKQVIDFVQQHEDGFTVIATGVAAYAGAMKAAATASAIMGLTAGPSAAAGIAAAGGAAAVNTPKVAGFAAALGRAAGAAGILAGLYMTNPAVKRELDEVGGGLKDIFTGKDIGGGIKDVLGLNDFPGLPGQDVPGRAKGGKKVEKKGRSGDDSRVQVPNVARRGSLRASAAPAAAPAAAVPSQPTVVQVMLDRRILGEAVIDDQEDRVARR